MTLHYKGYDGSAEVSVEDGVLHGKLLNIRDLITYQADGISRLEAEFRGAVDAYLEDCKLENRPADKPFKGSFNVRISPDLHRELAIDASGQSKSLNEYVQFVLSQHKRLQQLETRARLPYRMVVKYFDSTSASQVTSDGNTGRNTSQASKSGESFDAWTVTQTGSSYAKH